MTSVRRRARSLPPEEAISINQEAVLTLPELPELPPGRGRDEGVNPGYRLGRDYPEYADGLLVAITERRTREQIDQLASLVGAEVAA